MYGELILRFRVPPPLLAIGAAALMGWLDREMPILRLLVAPWNLVGWGFIGIGLCIDAVSVAAFVRAKTTVNPIHVDRATRLVVSGLYRVSRYPMYLGMICLLLGWALLLGSLLPFLVVVAFERLIVVVQIRPEEAALAARFGDEYAQYVRGVNRWFGWSNR